MIFVSDQYGNTATIAFWGSEDAARASLATLTECRNCRNCSDCSGCSDCSLCSYCSYCSGCLDCSGCSYCSRCSYCSGCLDCSDCSDCSRCSRVKDIDKKPAVIGPSRSDGYQFVITMDGGVRAGCRVFGSFEEARMHWLKTRGGTLLGKETQRILDWCEAEYKARKQNA